MVVITAISPAGYLDKDVFGDFAIDNMQQGCLLFAWGVTDKDMLQFNVKYD